MPAIYAIVLILLVVGDQTLKLYVVNNIATLHFQEVIPGILSLTHITNTGAAWSMLEGKMIFFYIVTIIAIIILSYLFIKAPKNSYTYRFSLIFLLAGTVGNAIDRFTQHYVIDMFSFDFVNFPIFNLADTYITVGVILIIISLIFTSAGDQYKH